MLIAVLLMIVGAALWLGAVALELIAIGLAFAFVIWIAQGFFRMLCGTSKPATRQNHHNT